METKEILYDHYKDTCSLLCTNIKQRERLMIMVIGTLAMFSFHALFPGSSDQFLNDFLSHKYGLLSSIDLSIIGNVVWLLLLVFTVKYFQSVVNIERQYNYIHKLEDKLNQFLGESIITREGKSYLSNYPKFSDWTWALYAIIFPLLLFFAGLSKIISEWVESYNLIDFGLILNTLIFVMLSVSIYLYLHMVHINNKKDSVGKEA